MRICKRLHSLNNLFIVVQSCVESLLRPLCFLCLLPLRLPFTEAFCQQGVRENTIVMQASDLNSVPPFYKGHEKTQPIMHLANTPDEVRAKVLEHVAAGVGADARGTMHLRLETTELERVTNDAYRQLWAAGSSDARVPMALAAAERDEGHEARALELLQQAVDLAPQNPDGPARGMASSRCARRSWLARLPARDMLGMHTEQGNE